MESLINRLIFLNVELEGALRVAASRPSPEALSNAKRKFEELSASFADLDLKALEESKEETLNEVKLEEAEEGEKEPMAESVFSGEELQDKGSLNDEKDSSSVKEDKILNESIKSVRKEIGQSFEIRREPIELRKMFTLNDKFLFKRELFGNNDSEFNETISLISSMDSFEEVEEYIYEDMRWDSTDPYVRDFMAVVELFFNEKS